MHMHISIHMKIHILQRRCKDLKRTHSGIDMKKINQWHLRKLQDLHEWIDVVERMQ
jgi:hypothetical protein